MQSKQLPATRKQLSDVKEDLEQKITDVKEDLEQKITEVKGDLEQKITDFKEDLEQKITDTKEDLREEIAINSDRLDEKNRGYRDQILTGVDKIIKEIETIREENAAANLHFDRLDDNINNHEKRIKHLASPTA